MPTKLLSKSNVSDILGLHENSVMRLVREGKFPKPFRTGNVGSAVRWREEDISEWLNQKAAEAGGVQ